MSRTAVLNLRIEPEVKAEAEELFGSFGLTVTDAINVFLRQSLMHGGFPFEIVNKIDRTQAIRDAISRNRSGDKFYTSDEFLEHMQEAVAEGRSYAGK